MKIRTPKSACYVLAAMTTVAFAATDTPAPIGPRTGEIREYADRYLGISCKTWTTTSVDPAGMATSECGDYALTTLAMADFNPVRITRKGTAVVEFVPFFPEVSLPLVPGKTWAGQYEGFRSSTGFHWSSKVNCEAKNPEQIPIGGILVEAFPVECEDHWTSRQVSGVNHSTHWYAPAIASAVKTTNREDGTLTSQLVKFTPGK